MDIRLFKISILIINSVHTLLPNYRVPGDYFSFVRASERNSNILLYHYFSQTKRNA